MRLNFIDATVGKRFQNSDNGFNNAGRGIEFVALCGKLLITLFKYVGYVAQENKSYDHFPVFCCGNMSPKDTRCVQDFYQSRLWRCFR